MSKGDIRLRCKSALLCFLMFFLPLLTSACGPVRLAEHTTDTEAGESKFLENITGTSSDTVTTESADESKRETIKETYTNYSSPATELITATKPTDSSEQISTTTENKNKPPIEERPTYPDNNGSQTQTQKLEWTDIFEKVLPSVVQIRLIIPASNIYGEREEIFSGLIISEEGLVISSYSMFNRAVDYRGVLMSGATIEVFVSGYTKAFAADIYAFDAMSDIVILQVDPGIRKLTAYELGTQTEISVGLPIAVVTSAELNFLGGSLIPGYIVSVEADGQREDSLPYGLFVSDVPSLNLVPGAPVFNEYGTVLGICSGSSQYSNLDRRTYVVPSNVISKVTELLFDLADKAAVQRPTLGVAVMSDDAAYRLFQRYNYPEGLYLMCVLSDSPAYTAGLRAGDIIVAMNNEPVKSADDLLKFMEGKSIGAYCEMMVYRPSEDAELVFSSYLTQARY